MLKFFRKIRQQLLSENHISKYLLYAIGEILLVVIGILIALQANNWNQHRMNHQSALQHLSILKENIKDDQVQLQELVKEMDAILAATSLLIKQYKTVETVSAQTPDALVQLLNELSLNPNKSGLETLKTIGEMAYLEDSLQQEILDYYNLLDQLKESEDIANSYVQKHYEPHILHHYNQAVQYSKMPALVAIYKDDPRGKTTFEKTPFLKDGTLEMLVVARYFQSTRTKMLYDKTLEMAAQILGKI